MKNLPLISIALITLTSPHCFAETENFDMTLSGDFSKDYCELSISNTAPHITIDSSLINQYPQSVGDGDEIYYQVYKNLNSTATVTCTTGEYTVSINDYTNYGFISLGDLVGHVYVDHYIGGAFYNTDSINNMMAIPFGETNPRTFPSATITNGTGEAARFELSLEMYVSERLILDSPDSLSTTLNYVISIDKIN